MAGRVQNHKRHSLGLRVRYSHTLIARFRWKAPMIAADSIATARLVLRPMQREDGGHLLRLIDNWSVARWLGAVPWPYTAGDMTEFIENVALPRRYGPKPVFAILLEGAPIGAIECIAHPNATTSNASDLGYWLGEPHWGNGYMTEALAALVERAFAAPEAAVIHSGLFEGNAASLAVQQKLGFEVVGNGLVRCRPQGRELPHIRTRLTRARYEAMKR
jgi:RimJ/RimL family protein N-acetyltransferase